MFATLRKSSKLFRVNGNGFHQRILCNKFTTNSSLSKTAILNSDYLKNHNDFNLKRIYSTKSSFQYNLNQNQSFQANFKNEEILKPKKLLLFKSVIASLFISAVSLYGLAYLFQKNITDNKEARRDRPLPEFALLDILLPTWISDYKHEQNLNWESIKHEVKFRCNILTKIFKDRSPTQTIIYSIVALNATIIILNRYSRFRRIISRRLCHYAYSERYYATFTGCLFYKPISPVIVPLIFVVISSELVDSIGLRDYELVGFFITSVVICALTRRIAFCFMPDSYKNILLSSGLSVTGFTFSLLSYIQTTLSNGKWVDSFYNEKGEINVPRSIIPTLGLLSILLGKSSLDYYAILIGYIYGHIYAKWGFDYVWKPVNRNVFFIRKIMGDNE